MMGSSLQKQIPNPHPTESGTYLKSDGYINPIATDLRI